MAQGQGATPQRQLRTELRDEAFLTPLLETFTADPRSLVGMTYPMVKAIHKRRWTRTSRRSGFSQRTFKRRVSTLPRLLSADRRAVLFPGARQINLDPDFRLPAFGGRKTHADYAVLLDLGGWIHSLSIVGREKPPTPDHVPYRPGEVLHQRGAEAVTLPPTTPGSGAPPWADESMRLVLDTHPPTVIGLRLRG